MKETFKFTFDNFNQKLAANDRNLRKQQLVKRQVSYLQMGASAAVNFTGKQNDIFGSALTRKEKLSSRNVLNKLCQREYSAIQKSIQDAFVIEEIEQKKSFDYDLMLEGSD